jgi:predicted lactoylglutathione lyase
VTKETTMTTAKRKLFVNLPVHDLKRSMDFFAGLGFSFNPQFTDEKAACMIVNEDAYFMLLMAPFFQTFTHRELCDTSRHTEGLFALSCESRGEVDALVKKALETGGKAAMPPIDMGFMYSGSFYDPDGHHWEVLFMEPQALQG